MLCSSPLLQHVLLCHLTFPRGLTLSCAAVIQEVRQVARANTQEASIPSDLVGSGTLQVSINKSVNHLMDQSVVGSRNIPSTQHIRPWCRRTMVGQKRWERPSLSELPAHDPWCWRWSLGSCLSLLQAGQALLV